MPRDVLFFYEIKLDDINNVLQVKCKFAPTEIAKFIELRLTRKFFTLDDKDIFINLEKVTSFNLVSQENLIKL